MKSQPRLGLAFFRVLDHLFHNSVVVLLAGLRVTGRGGGITEGEGADADEAFREAEFLHQGLAFVGGEHFTFAVDPAGAEADGVGGVHHVAEHERAIRNGVRPDGRVGAEHKHISRGTVEGVDVPAPDRRVHPGNLLQEVRILHGHDPGVLETLRGRGPGAGLEDGLEFVVGNLLRLVAPAAPALSQRPQYFVVHMIRV